MVFILIYIKYKSNWNKNKTLLTDEYLNKIRPYLKNTMGDLKDKTPDTWKIQLATVINFMFPKDNNEERVMPSRSDNVEIVINDEEDTVIITST